VTTNNNFFELSRGFEFWQRKYFAQEFSPETFGSYSTETTLRLSLWPGWTLLTLHSWDNYSKQMTSTKRTASRPLGLQIGNYQLRETIGIGAFGKVKGSYNNMW